MHCGIAMCLSIIPCVWIARWKRLGEIGLVITLKKASGMDQRRGDWMKTKMEFSMAWFKPHMPSLTRSAGLLISVSVGSSSSFNWLEFRSGYYLQAFFSFWGDCRYARSFDWKVQELFKFAARSDDTRRWVFARCESLYEAIQQESRIMRG